MDDDKLYIWISKRSSLLGVYCNGRGVDIIGAEGRGWIDNDYDIPENAFVISSADLYLALKTLRDKK